MGKFRLPLFLIIITYLTTQAFSQTTGKIAGKIIDKSTNAPIPFANVYVEGTSQGAGADENGEYTILGLKPGTYSVTASVVGYQKVTITNVNVNVDFTTRLNFELSQGQVNLPAVVVKGERNPLIRQDLTNPTVAITDQSIQQLPVDQISDVIALQAGVVKGDNGALHVRGGYDNEIDYTLNGVSINDPFGNKRGIGLATNAVQEVSVSTGTFTAEYGNALSGVVNYVTKEGGPNYTFSLRGYSGDYVSDRTALFTNINHIDPLNRGRLEATLGGPVPFLHGLEFYTSSVYENYKGAIYGKRLYNPTDSYLTPDNFSSSDPRAGSSTDPYYFNPYSKNSNGKPTGDSALVSMDPSRNFNFQGNISYKITPTIKLKYEAVYNQGHYKDYLRRFRFNPDGEGTHYNSGLIQTFDITHTVSENLFYTLKGSYSYDQTQYYLYKSPYDPRYLDTLYTRDIGNTVFIAGGTDNSRTYQKTTTFGLKGDLVAELFNTHEVKAGFELRKFRVQYNAYSTQIGKIDPNGNFNTNIQPADLLYDSSLVLQRRIPTEPSLYTQYDFKPTQFAAYILDKIELASSLILNAGLRYEYFDPSASYNPQLSKNLTDSLSGYITAYDIPSTVKQTIAPRISISYPITDKGVIRLSYGHFYQMGSLKSLYTNPNNYVTNVGETPRFGNANVKPQRSVQYEIGLQQQLSDDIRVDLTGFYKDVSNYIYTQTVYTNEGREYQVLTNLAYANTRGITLSFFKRRSPGSIFQASLDYTFSIAEGNRTEPSDQIFFSQASGQQTETFLVPLSFDRTHVINATVALIPNDNWNIGIIANYQTGTPYTPLLPSQLSGVNYIQNSANKPSQWNVDLKIERYFKIGPLTTSLFLQINNLFDTQNELYVYQSSGRALSNVEQTVDAANFQALKERIARGDAGMFGESVIDNYYSDRPGNVSLPREVRLGFSILFN